MSIPTDSDISGAGTVFLTRPQIFAIVDEVKEVVWVFCRIDWHSWLFVDLFKFGNNHAACAADHVVYIHLHNVVHDLAVTVSMVIGYFVILCCIACQSSSLEMGVLSERKNSSNTVKARARYTIYLSFVSVPLAERSILTNVECFVLSTLSFHTGTSCMAFIVTDLKLDYHPCFSHKRQISCHHGESWCHPSGMPVWCLVFGVQNMKSF